MQTYQTIFKQGNQILLTGCIFNQSLHLKLTVLKQKGIIHLYGTQLKDLNAYQNLSKFTLLEIFQYMKQQHKMIEIDQKNGIIKIKGTHSLKKQNIIVLAEIKLQLIQTKQNDALQKLINRCKNDYMKLDGEQIKQFFILIANLIKQSKKNEIKFAQLKQNQFASLQQIIINKLKQQELIQFEFKNMMEQQVQKIKKQIKNIWEIKYQLKQTNEKINYLQQIKIEIQEIKTSLQTLNQQNINIKSKIFNNQVKQQLTFDSIVNYLKQNNYLQNNQNKINTLSHKIQLNTQQIYNKLEQYEISKNKVNQNIIKIQQIETKINKLTKAQNWIDNKCHYYQNLLTNNDIIFCLKDQTHIFGSNKLLQNDQFSISITNIINYIKIGIVDSDYKQIQDLQQQQNLLWFDSTNDCYNGKQILKQQGDETFEQGDKITVVVSKQRGSIEWKVNGKVKHRLKCQQIKDKNIKWVPYIYLSQERESIRIL